MKNIRRKREKNEESERGRKKKERGRKSVARNGKEAR